MKQERNTQNQFGGEFMVQDNDHLSQVRQAPAKADKRQTRQSEQSHANTHQQGGEAHRKHRQQG